MRPWIFWIFFWGLFFSNSFLTPAYTEVNNFYAPCITGIGGDVENAAYACANSPPRALGGEYISADTLALGIPGMCVLPKAQFYFHSARVDGTMLIHQQGNVLLAETYGRWPRLLSYLQQHHVFTSFNLIHLSGAEMGALGVPLCRR
jgi:hypothetical protein